MSSRTTFLIPETTVSIVFALSRGLREILGLKIQGHEGWTLEKIGATTYAAIGKARITGYLPISTGLRAEITEESQTLSNETRRWWYIKLQVSPAKSSIFRALYYYDRTTGEVILIEKSRS